MLGSALISMEIVAVLDAWNAEKKYPAIVAKFIENNLCFTSY